MKEDNPMKKRIKYLLCIIYLLFICFIMFYSFDNASLTIKFIFNTEADVQVNRIEVYKQQLDRMPEAIENLLLEKDGFALELSNSDIKDIKNYYLDIFSDNLSKNIYEVIIIRNRFEVKRIGTNEFYFNYLKALDHTDDIGTSVTERLHTNEAFYELLNNLSASLLIERITMMIGITTIFAVGAIGIDLFSYEKRSNKKLLSRFCGDVRSYAYFIVYSARTDLKAEVANSYLNWIWWILEPLFNMLVYYFVFGKIFANKQEYFIIFIYSGLLMWSFFNKTIMYSIKLVRGNKGIITSVYIPKHILLLSNMMLNGIKLLISIGILIIMLIVYRVPVNGTIIYFPIVYISMIMFTFGCGLIMLHYGVFIDDLAYAVNILLNILFFLSGVFYDLKTAITEPWGYILLKFNPIAMYINAMRGALLYEQTPNLLLFAYWTVVAFLLCIVGIKIVYKYENSYVKVV